jgi:hypothetical protein
MAPNARPGKPLLDGSPGLSNSGDGHDGKRSALRPQDADQQLEYPY